MAENVIKIELRSDTFTKPTKEMLEEMIQAEVGDAVYDEDPTMLKLEKTMADLLGKEASIFMPTGTMANLIGVMSHCNERGCEVIVGDQSHFNLYEQGGVSQVGGVYSRQVPNLSDGTFDLELVEDLIQDHTDAHCTKTKVICVENTQNHCGGKVLPTKFLDDLHSLCVKHDIKVHLDGSRLFNASLVSKQSLAEMAKHCDSVNFCFSKGLGAPVGSMLIGSKDYIKRAYRLRKLLGGSMRQTGLLASCCLHALRNAETNLRLDHSNAQKLGKGIQDVSRGVVEVDLAITNITHVRIIPKDLTITKFIERLRTVTDEELTSLKKSIVVNVGDSDKRTMRLLTNLNVSTADVDLTIQKFNFICQEFSKIYR